MPRFSDPLSRVRVASPCPADWDSMVGDERVRFCGQCELNVYNLSAMSRAQAENLLARAEGRLCVRFYRRRDGSILTQDCPVGLRALRQRMSRIKRAVVATVVGFFAGAGGTVAFNGLENAITNSVIGVRRTVMGTIAEPVKSPVNGADMGTFEVGKPVAQSRVSRQKHRRRHQATLRASPSPS